MVKHLRMRSAILTALFCLSFVPASAQGLWPNTTYDPAVPTLKSVVGHAPGEAITAPADVVRYLETLAKAVPDRTRLVEYARSWEGRPLVYLAIGSPARLAKLDDVRRGLQTLASGASEADLLIADLPVVASTVRAGSAREIDVAFNSLPPGEYLVEISVNGAGEPVKELIGFRITG